MTILFLSMSRMTGITERGIYTDLMRKFRDEGNDIYIISPRERSLGEQTGISKVDGVHILGVRTLNLQKTSIVEKGIGQILVEFQFKKAIKKELGGIRFDLILYTTPPITFANTIKYVRLINPNAKTYLLLKDIFPQNAVDIGLLSQSGLSSLLYHHFRNKEKDLYALSDNIGCMSPANVEYLLTHNPEISSARVEVAPNSVEFCPQNVDSVGKLGIRKKYGLPTGLPIFIYGGNLGKPQGVPFLIECLEANANRNDCFFVVIGTGTEFSKIKEWYLRKQAKSVKVMEGLPKEEYERFVQACDVGMIFLDHRFTIPNYPSRLLSYLQNKMPIICATDPVTDIGRIAEKNGYGYWCESKSVRDFTAILDKMILSDRIVMGEKGYVFLRANYQVENTYNAIMSHV